jgi:NADH:ubiquinone oxidoreductase subunit 4 (subunit M)
LGERWRDQVDASRIESFSTAVLVGFVLLVGLFPFPFMRVIDSGVTELLARFPGVG